MAKRKAPMFLKNYEFSAFDDNATGEKYYTVYDLELLDFSSSTPVAGLPEEIRKVLLSKFKMKWAKAAVKAHAKLERASYFFPIHEMHNTKFEPKKLNRIGFGANLGMGDGSAGRPNPNIMYVDAIDILQDAFDAIKQRRLPYRSVEIISMEVPRISSLALMFNTPPVFQFPMLVLGKKRDEEVELGRKEVKALSVSGDLIGLDVNEVSGKFASFRINQMFGGKTMKKKGGRKAKDLNSQIHIHLDSTSGGVATKKSSKDDSAVMTELKKMNKRLTAMEKDREEMNEEKGKKMGSGKKRIKKKGNKFSAKGPKDVDDDRPFAFSANDKGEIEEITLVAKDGKIVKLNAGLANEIIKMKNSAKYEKLLAQYERKFSTLRVQGYVLDPREEAKFCVENFSSKEARLKYLKKIKSSVRKAPIGFDAVDVANISGAVLSTTLLKGKYKEYVKKYRDEPELMQFAAEAINELKAGNADGSYKVPKANYESYITDYVAEKIGDAKSAGSTLGW